jgi:hypothetical protein
MTMNEHYLMGLLGRFTGDLGTSLAAGSVVVGHNVQTQESSYTLGAQASEAAIQKMVTQTGFTRLRRITATPCAFVFEARRS